MNDIDFMQVDDTLYNLLIDYFKLDLENDLNSYHEFRNNVVDLIDELNRKKKIWKILLILIISEIGF